jgi:hypothetical protein
MIDLDKVEPAVQDAQQGYFIIHVFVFIDIRF